MAAGRRAALTVTALIMPLRTLPLLTTSAYYLCVLPLLTTSTYYLYLLGACSTSGRFSGLKYMSRSTRSTAWDTYGCRLGCVRLQAGMHAVTAGAHALQPGHVRLQPGHIRLQLAAQLQIRTRGEGSVAVVMAAVAMAAPRQARPSSCASGPSLASRRATWLGLG